MIGSLIISGLGLLLTNPGRKAKRRRKSRRKNPGRSGLAAYASQVVQALVWTYNAAPKIPRAAMGMVREAHRLDIDHEAVAGWIANGRTQLSAGTRKAFSRNPWTHGTLGLGDTRAAKGLAAAHRSRDAEQDRHRYLRDAVEAAKAGAPLREICALTHAAGRIRKLTKDEIERVVKARGVGGRRNPGSSSRNLRALSARAALASRQTTGQDRDSTGARSTAMAAWRFSRQGNAVSAAFYHGSAAGGHLDAARRVHTAEAASAHRAAAKAHKAAALAYEANPARKNPPRDPKYVGAFALPKHPAKSNEFVDGDTATVESPYKPGRWEVWMFGMDDPRRGETWNYVGEEASRAAGEAQARKLLAYF